MGNESKPHKLIVFFTDNRGRIYGTSVEVSVVESGRLLVEVSHLCPAEVIHELVQNIQQAGVVPSDIKVIQRKCPCTYCAEKTVS